MFQFEWLNGQLRQFWINIEHINKLKKYEWKTDEPLIITYILILPANFNFIKSYANCEKIMKIIRNSFCFENEYN